VIHYDLPRSLEVFVHRAGRTARANREGLSFSLVGPRDDRMHQEVGSVLLQGEGLAAFPVDLQVRDRGIGREGVYGMEGRKRGSVLDRAEVTAFSRRLRVDLTMRLCVCTSVCVWLALVGLP
jgi:superfamily II DNA/RNA helicase